MTKAENILMQTVRWRHTIVNACFTAFAIVLTGYGLYTHGEAAFKGDLISWGVLIFYAFMLTLFFTRRSAQSESTRLPHRIIAFCASLLSLLLQPVSHHPFPWIVIIALALWGIGAAGSIVAIACLGRGFGIIAACRDVKTHGLYRWIRHPLYAFELVWFFSLVLVQLSWFNLALFAALAGCQILRLLEEERILTATSDDYRQYCERIQYRLFPGIF